MLYAFDLKFEWLPDNLVKEVNEKVEMLVHQDVSIMFAYQRILLSLAADCANPGRLLMIQFFSESVKKHVVKKICGMSQSDYRSQGRLRWLRTLFTEQSITYRRLIREINHVNGICLTFSHLRLQASERVIIEKKNNVTFNPEVIIHLIPYEDMRSEWMQCAINICNFQRRIQLFEELFTAL